MAREFALPGTRARYAPDRHLDILHIKIDIDVDVDQRRIAGRCSLTLTPIVRGLRWAQLDAVELDVTRVSSGGRDLDFTHDGKILRVDLGRDHDPGDQVTIDVDYSAEPRRGLYFVGPDEGYPDKPRQVWSQGQDEDSRYWFPCVDAPHEKASSELVVRVPAGFFALSNGTLLRDQQEGDRRTLHWRFDVPHSSYLITLAAGELGEIVDQWNEVDVRYYAQPDRLEDCRRTLGKTPEMIELFSRLFGVPYPYEKYAQVFVADFIFGGMENTTATTLTDTVLLDERAALDFDVESLVAHELAHQWFGDLITCRDWGEGWLNEGFATYSEYLWREHSEGHDAASLELEDWADHYFGEDSSRYRRTVATKVYDEPIDIFDAHLYEKGGRILHMLRRLLGDEPFWSSIRHYLTKHRTGSVETRDLARAIEEATGRVVDWFFDQWVIQGAGHPELEVGSSWDAETGLATITVTQTHEVKAPTPLFRLPTAVRFRVGDDDVDLPIEILDKQHSFVFALDQEPTQAIFDPGKHLLARVTCKKSTALWRAELASAREAIDRVYAARELGKIGGRDATRSLIEALDGDPFWGVQAAAATALGAVRTTAARDALVAAIATTSHPRARRAVVRALGNFRRDETAAEALEGVVVAGDPSYFVEAESCLALGKTRSPRAGATLRAAQSRDSFTDIIRQHVYRGLAEARDDDAIELLLDATRYGAPSHGRRAAAGALAQLCRGRRDREATRVRERLEELLRDPDFRIQSAAIEALATIADPAAVGALQELAWRDLDGRLRRRSREVIRDLEEGRAQGEQVSGLRDEVDRLRHELFGLRERLEKLDRNGDPTGTARLATVTRVRRTGGKKTIATSRRKPSPRR